MNDLKTVRDEILEADLNCKQVIIDILDRMIETPATQGWKLVPIEPTKNMYEHGVMAKDVMFSTGAGLNTSYFPVGAIYQAMLSATPTPAPPPQTMDVEANINKRVYGVLLGLFSILSVCEGEWKNQGAWTEYDQGVMDAGRELIKDACNNQLSAAPTPAPICKSCTNGMSYGVDGEYPCPKCHGNNAPTEKMDVEKLISEQISWYASGEPTPIDEYDKGRVDGITQAIRNLANTGILRQGWK